MIATTLAATLLLAPIPPAKAFVLPSTRECVGFGTLALQLREPYEFKRVTVKVGGKAVKRVSNPSTRRAIVIRQLPQRTFTLSVSARTDDGRSASVRRKFTACPQGAKPKVAIPDAPPPTTLGTRDLVVGTGALAGAGTLAQVHYFMKTWSNRKEVDASYAGPFQFELGSRSVIEGFDQGVTGMRVGGRREIVIPPELGYGEQGAPPAVAPDETLVFVVDLVAVTS